MITVLSRWRWYAAMIALGLLTVLVWYHWDFHLVDLCIYRDAGAVVAHGQPLYEASWFDDLPFTYPPFAVLLFYPLHLAPVLAVKLGWILLTGLVGLRFAHLAVRLLRCSAHGAHVRWLDEHRVGALTGATFLFFASGPVLESFRFGQINLILALLVLEDLARPRGSRARGIGVGLATGIKLTPGIFLIGLLVTRQWREALVAAGTTAGTIVLSWLVLPRDTVYFFGTVLRDSSRPGPLQLTYNQSLRGLVSRLIGPDASAIPWAVLVLAALVLGFLLVTALHQTGDELGWLAVTGILGPLVSPISWAHHWFWLVPLLLVWVSWVWRMTRPGAPVRRVALIGIPVVLAFLASRADRMIAPPGLEDRAPWWTFPLVNDYLVVGIGVLVWLAVVVRRSHRGTMGAPITRQEQTRG